MATLGKKAVSLHFLGGNISNMWYGTVMPNELPGILFVATIVVELMQ